MRKGVGDVLREEGLLDEEALQAGQRRARRDAIPLLFALVEEGRVTEAQAIDALERRLKLPRVDPSTVFVDAEALREVTYNLAVGRCLLPIAVERQGGLRVLRVVMADPLDHEAIDEIEASSGCRVAPMLAPASTLLPEIERAYRGIVTKMIPRGGIVREARATDPLPETPTQPHHRLEDAAPADTRLRALVLLLVEKGVISDEEYQETLRQLLRGERG